MSTCSCPSTLPTGDLIAITISAVVGIDLIVIGLFFSWRRWKRASSSAGSLYSRRMNFMDDEVTEAASTVYMGQRRQDPRLEEITGGLRAPRVGNVMVYTPPASVTYEDRDPSRVTSTPRERPNHPLQQTQTQQLVDSPPTSDSNHQPSVIPLIRPSANPTSFYSQPVSSSLSNQTPYDPPVVARHMLRPIRTANLTPNRPNNTTQPLSINRRPTLPQRPPRPRSPLPPSPSASSLFSRFMTTLTGPRPPPPPPPNASQAPSAPPKDPPTSRILYAPVETGPPPSPLDSHPLPLPPPQSPPRSIRPLPVPLGSMRQTGRKQETLPGYV